MSAAIMINNVIHLRVCKVDNFCKWNPWTSNFSSYSNYRIKFSLKQNHSTLNQSKSNLTIFNSPYSTSHCLKTRLHSINSTSTSESSDKSSSTDSNSNPLEDMDSIESDSNISNPSAIASAVSALIADDSFSAIKAVQVETVQIEQNTESKFSSTLSTMYSMSKTWTWEGYNINYVRVGEGPSVVLIHGFGASIGHFRKNVNVLSKKYTVFAIDLLGLGASEKPLNYKYTIENWAQLLIDFLNQVVKSPAVLVGNSIGSLIVLLVSSQSTKEVVRGSVLLNCAGGMNNKAIMDDWRIFILLPLFFFIDWLLSQPKIALNLFNKFKTEENVRTVLKSVYCNKEAVDDELVEIIVSPSNDEGALEAFVSVITGPPGPRPETLVPKITHPVLLLWGDKDTFTPMDGPIGKYFQSLPQTFPNVKFIKLPGVGHCPHDDDPDSVHEILLPWLEKVEFEG